MTEERTRLALSLQAAAVGEGFEILAITAGSGNGWVFRPAPLRASLALWENAACFIDHAPRGHSLRDLAGVCTGPRWDEEAGGVRMQLRPLGPAAGLLREIGSQMTNPQGAPLPDIGFSADVLFNAEGREVRELLRVYSIDLVYQPARGGAFLRALNQRQEQTLYGGEIVNEETQNLTNDQATAAADSGQTAALNAMLLENALAAARLPEPAAAQLRQRFSGRIFSAAEINSAVEDARRLVSALTGGLSVNGPGRVEQMFSGQEQFSAALHDLLGVERPEALKNAAPARLSGIRELYTLMTGDTGFTGGYYPERASFATSADLPGVLKNALNKLIVAQWEELGRSGYRWWESVVTVEHFNSLQAISGVLVGELTVLPAVAEGAAYTALAVSDSTETAEWGKYGGYIGLTLEMFERDETHKLRAYPRKLASAALRRISSLVASIFTANSGAGPQMADGYNVFDAAHHANLGTSALSQSAWEAASKAIYTQPLKVASGGTAPRQAVDARYCIVPRDLRLTAAQILYPSFAHEANIFSENLQRGQMGDVITCPEFSDANDWAAAADPRLAPAIFVAERFGVMPEIFIADSPVSGALFTNDELRMKVRHWVSVFVADYRPLFKANVA